MFAKLDGMQPIIDEVGSLSNVIAESFKPIVLNKSSAR